MGSINELLRPELEREGAIKKTSPSSQGEISYILYLRIDPCVFQDTDGQ